MVIEKNFQKEMECNKNEKKYVFEVVFFIHRV